MKIKYVSNHQLKNNYNMKKSVLLFVMVFLPFISFSQSIFDKFEGHVEVVSIVVNKKMFEMMCNVKTNDKESQQILRLTKGLNKLKVYTNCVIIVCYEMKTTYIVYLMNNVI